jgi:hypothetical protein
MSSLRQIDERTFDAAAVLFKPGTAIRFDWNKWPDTPLPPWEPAGQNPPDGAIVDYYLKGPVSGVVTLEILNAAGTVVRRYSSDDKPREIRDEGNVPYYWIRPTRIVSTAAGMHRFVWDLHYPPPAGVSANYPISATPGDTEPEPKGPWVVPGTYTVKLTAGGTASTQPLIVKMDPRVKSGALALQQQFTLAKKVYDAINQIQETLPRLAQAREKSQAAGDTAVAQRIQTLVGGGGGGRGRGGGRGAGGGTPTLSSTSAQLLSLYGATQEGSGPPPAQTLAAVNAALAQYQQLITQANAIVKP